MVPYRARLLLRIARISLAVACLAWYGWVAGARFTSVHAVLAAYLVYAIGSMFEWRFDSPSRAALALIADTGFFGFWTWVAAAVVPGWVAAGWLSAWICGYLLASAVMLHEMDRVLAVAGVAFALSMLLSRPGDAGAGVGRPQSAGSRRGRRFRHIPAVPRTAHVQHPPL